MNPISKCTLPHLIAEWVIDTRSKFIKTFPNIKRGHGWSTAISRQVRGLCQQASVLCNYFDHPDDDRIVYAAFKNYFTKNRIFKIGQYRKVRLSKEGKINITQDEKDVVKGILMEYMYLKNKYTNDNIIQKPTDNLEYIHKPKIREKNVKIGGRFSKLIDAEQKSI